MDKIDRYKSLIRHITSSGIASTQKEFAAIIGYSNESSFSQIINGKVKEPKDFTTKLKSQVPALNLEWLQTGEGEMFIESANESNDISQRLKQYIHLKELSVRKFELEAGLPNGFVSKINNDVKNSSLDKIRASYPELNIEWVMTGSGHMLRPYRNPDDNTIDMSVKERLIEYIEYKNLKVSHFEKSVGLCNSYVRNIRQSLGAARIERIATVYPDLNIEWLLTGKGSMLNTTNGDKAAQPETQEYEEQKPIPQTNTDEIIQVLQEALESKEKEVEFLRQTISELQETIKILLKQNSAF